MKKYTSPGVQIVGNIAEMTLQFTEGSVKGTGGSDFPTGAEFNLTDTGDIECPYSNDNSPGS